MIAVITTTKLGKLLHQYGDFDNFPDDLKAFYMPLVQWLKKHSGKLEPTFPQTSDERMQTYFSLAIQSSDDDINLKPFLKLPGIDGAYEKPMDDMPV